MSVMMMLIRRNCYISSTGPVVGIGLDHLNFFFFFIKKWREKKPVRGVSPGCQAWARCCESQRQPVCTELTIPWCVGTHVYLQNTRQAVRALCFCQSKPQGRVWRPLRQQLSDESLAPAIPACPCLAQWEPPFFMSGL